VTCRPHVACHSCICGPREYLNTFNICFPLKMMDNFWETWWTLHARFPSSTLAPMGPTRWSHISEDHNCDNFKSRSLTFSSSILNLWLTFLNILIFHFIHLCHLDERITWNWILQKQRSNVWIGFTWLMIGIIGEIMQMHSEPLGFIKCRFLVTTNRNLMCLLQWSTFN
jgi:hypothetical protein